MLIPSYYLARYKRLYMPPRNVQKFGQYYKDLHSCKEDMANEFVDVGDLRALITIFRTHHFFAYTLKGKELLETLRFVEKEAAKNWAYENRVPIKNALAIRKQQIDAYNIKFLGKLKSLYIIGFIDHATGDGTKPIQVRACDWRPLSPFLVRYMAPTFDRTDAGYRRTIKNIVDRVRKIRRKYKNDIELIEEARQVYNDVRLTLRR